MLREQGPERLGSQCLTLPISRVYQASGLVHPTATRPNPDYLDFVVSAIACFRQPSTATEIEGTF
jgi:hypothetical protein